MTQHRWANADRDLRFNDLFNLIIDPAVLLLTWQRARRTRGALMLLQVPPNQARPGGTAEIRDLTSYPHNFEWLVSVVSCWATLDGRPVSSSCRAYPIRSPCCAGTENWISATPR